MLEYVIVGLIVAAAALYVLRKYLPKSLRARLFGKAAAQDDGCGSGCGSCSSGCETTQAQPPAPPNSDARRRVIEIRSR